MCYDVKYLTKKLADYEKRYGDIADLTEIAKKIDPAYQPHPKLYYHTNAFTHEKLPVIKSGEQVVDFISWGLIPGWVKNSQDALSIQQKTLNARGEELFDKPSFRSAAQSQRCIIILDGFYEHHHRLKKTFPYHIQLKDRQPLSVAGLWDLWTDPASGEQKQTVTIVTTRGNELMSEIHNHPELAGPRMPVILDKDTEGFWIEEKPFSQKQVDSFLRPFESSQMEAYPVRALRGKNGIGNRVEATQPFQYPELQKGLFDM